MENQNQELGLIIDLTFTTKYYRLTDVPQSCSYMKILTEGHRVPSDATILSFKRTGYLVCRYLIDVDGLRAV